MSPRLRNLSLALLAGAALVVAGTLPTPFGALGLRAAYAHGNGGGGGGSGGNGGSSNHGGGAGNSASTSHGQSGLHANVASTGNQSSGTPHSIIRQYVIATGLSQGQVASQLKSWNSLNRNPKAFAAAMKNPNSLPALQIAYIKDNVTAQADLAAFVKLGGNPNNPPTLQQDQSAQAYISASQELAAAKVTAATVLAAPPGTYSQALVAAATTVNSSSFTSVADAQTVVDQYNAWSTYQTAEATALDAFKAASVSYKNSSPATLDALKKLVDSIVTTEGLDTMVSNL